MKSNEGKTFRIQVLTNMLYSLILTGLIEMFLVGNVIKLAVFMTTEAQVQSRTLETIARLDTLVVLLFSLCGVITFAVIFWILQRKSFAYIVKISDAMRDISGGDLSVKLDVDGDDEFSGMASNLNSMVDEIKTLMDKEREAERTKNELITNVAHDLRTPLTSIIGYLDLLSSKKDLDSEMKNQFTQIAYVKARKLEQLIEDLFSFTKLNYGRIALKLGKVDIVKLLSQLLTEFYPDFMEKDLTYDLESNVPGQVITADASLIARLFDNLINNAIKYGADGKLISVKIHAGKDSVKVSVVNYGKIIPADELPLIFNRFYRVEQSRSSKTGGTGLGLAIAKNIVQMHSGTIKVTSDLSGTAFIVKLPIEMDLSKEKFSNEKTD